MNYEQIKKDVEKFQQIAKLYDINGFYGYCIVNYLHQRNGTKCTMKWTLNENKRMLVTDLSRNASVINYINGMVSVHDEMDTERE